MSNLSSLTVVLDGITAQHAGELLFDSEITTEQRRECRETYIRCLEDFSFAVLFGSKFSFSGSLPKVGQESPGLLLTDTFSPLFHKLDAPIKQTSEKLLDRSEYQAQIALDLECLDRALQTRKNLWKHWMIREAKSYLGDHSSLFKAATPSSEFEYGKDPKYLVRRELQDRIPAYFIDTLVKELRSQKDLPRVVEPALREFVSRNALTLMTIDLWCSLATTEAFGKDGIRVPHAIRSLVRQAQLQQQMDPHVRKARTLITKLALADAVCAEDVSTREDLVTRLYTMRDEWPYPKIRELVHEFIVEIGFGA